MDTVDRRTILATGALALAGAATQSGPAAAQAGPKSIFPVGVTTIPIVGETDVFPVRRIYCIGRNYAAHSREMGSDPTREPPFFFQKPTDAIQNVAIGDVADHPYPSLTKNYHHEVELVAALKSGGNNIPPEQALDHVYGYALGLDMTRRDLQSAHGRRKEAMGNRQELRPRRRARTDPSGREDRPFHQGRDLAGGQRHRQAELEPPNMIWNVAEQIAKLSEAFELKAGDIIYSGTPENVGPVVKGDVLLCKIEGLPDMSIRIM